MWAIVMMSICALWFISELLIAILTRSKKSESKSFDKNSLGLLWLVIIPSIFAGIYIAVSYPMYNVTEYFLGLFLIIAGMTLRLIAIFSLKTYFNANVSIHHDHKLKTDGMYSIVRHPSYTGALLSFLGLGLAQGNWISLLIIFIPVTMAFIYRINIEEKVLTENFKEVYLIYKKKTKKLIPYIY
jgi:protein-S-isoprenylcysteine O-methyltransferase Ste14